MENSSQSATQPADTLNEPETPDLPSCESCRKRKLKCSRQLPLCSNCERLDITCAYDGKKVKPGVKSGAVESLNRRLEIVENALLEKRRAVENDEVLQRKACTDREHQGSQSNVGLAQPLTAETQVVDVLSSLSTQIQKLCSAIEFNGFASQNRPASSFDDRPGQPYSSLGQPQYKRRRLYETDTAESPTFARNGRIKDDLEHQNYFSNAPRVERLEQMLDVFLTNIQPWIPMIHIARFPKLLKDPAQQRRKSIVLHAIQVATLRHLKDSDGLPLNQEQVEREVKRSRDIVMLSAMDGLSVENLQALSLIAFSDIGNGDPQKAWPIIGSLTRSVEYLNLTVESEDSKPRGGLLQPTSTLTKPKDWIDEEERRRVFWNIFNLDRFCSVTTGSNISLTAADVSRRLPVCGGIWYHGGPAMTPYFGIWDRSTARIGNSISFLPEHYPSPSQTVGASPDAARDTNTPKSDRGSRLAKPTLNSGQQGGPDMSNVGAFAYYIESLESLSRITTYFLQQEVDLQNRQQLTAWLTRFKELDLRLVHWKMFLPRQWQDSGMSRETMPGVMDPNMTVAHTTHNTSMILLHQRIAYPTEELKTIKLPSLYSAETCRSAATETTTITKSYLDKSSPQAIVSPQMAFAAFVSARVLLVHSKYYGSGLPPEFFTLIDILEGMHSRWIGPNTQGGQNAMTNTLFGQFATRLRGIHERFLKDPSFNIDVAGQFDDVTWEEELLTPATRQPETSPNLIPPATEPPSKEDTLHLRGVSDQAQNANPDTVSSTQHPNRIKVLEPWQWSQPHIPPDPLEAHIQGGETDDLSAISQILMGQQFMDMDRVISFEDIMQPSWDQNEGKSLGPWQAPNDDFSSGAQNVQGHLY